VGRAIALACGRAGADVAVHFKGSGSGARETALALQAMGRRAPLVQGDQAEPGAPERIVAEAASALGGLDLLVLSAAAYERLPAEDLDHARFLSMLEQDLLGPFLLARAALPHLRAGSGCIVTLLDLCGTSQTWPRTAHYGAAKAGLAQVTRTLALEWAPEVRVNGVAPGLVLPPADLDAAERAALVARIPLSREGSPEDVAQAVVFFACAPFVTGQILAVDGGRSAAP
jgi:NAD(P)-dependent dehydrogenase (short-subunit alcohol dehydrogenase family)